MNVCTEQLQNVRFKGQKGSKYEKGENKMQSEKHSILEERLALAERGRLYWNEFTEENSIDRTKTVILMPEDGAIYHEEVLRNLPDFAESTKPSEIILLIEDESVFKQAESWIAGNKCVCQFRAELISYEDVAGLLALNQLYRFTSRLIIDAYENVEDADAGRLIGTCGITLRDIVRISILGLPE